MKENKVKKNPEKFICPRCGGLIPSNEQWGEYIGAVSRHTRLRGVAPLEVCSECGTEEALEEHFGSLTPVERYPIINDATVARRFGAIAILEKDTDLLDPPALDNK
jgi:transcription elongation factor Elf1